MAKIEPSKGSGMRKASAKGRDLNIRVKSVKKMVNTEGKNGNEKIYEKVLLYGGHTESRDFLELATSLMEESYVQ